MVTAAVSQAAHRGKVAWWACQTCKQKFTGPIRSGLAGAWCSRVCDHVEESIERLAAAHRLAPRRPICRGGADPAGGACGLHVDTRSGHPDTLRSAHNLATCISSPGRCAKAELIHREVHAAFMREHGPEHPETLTSTANLAMIIWHQRRYAEAELIHWAVHAACCVRAGLRTGASGYAEVGGKSGHDHLAPTQIRRGRADAAGRTRHTPAHPRS